MHIHTRFACQVASIFTLFLAACCTLLVLAPSLTFADTSTSDPELDSFQARPPIHAFMGASPVPQGLSPRDIRAAYNLPTSGGTGTIAIISAFHHQYVETDLAQFSKSFGLTECSIKNKCLTIHAMASSSILDDGWDLETALDTEWAHAVAPKSKILVVEAASDKGSDLLKAVDYASAQPDVVSISMSWGGKEFASETKLDNHFTRRVNSTSNKNLAFFASSGDDGNGVNWPAVSPHVISVGGTRLLLHKSQSAAGVVNTSVASEKAWDGSGGGVSQYEKSLSWQTDYAIPRANGMRAVPDVAYAADPMYGFSVYHFSLSDKNWYIIGGTSAGAPQWAAIHALRPDFDLQKLYADKAEVKNASYFRDITSGKNGSCAYYCVARKHYDYVTGLGAPVTWKF